MSLNVSLEELTRVLKISLVRVGPFLSPVASLPNHRRDQQGHVHFERAW